MGIFQPSKRCPPLSWRISSREFHPWKSHEKLHNWILRPSSNCLNLHWSPYSSISSPTIPANHLLASRSNNILLHRIKRILLASNKIIVGIKQIFLEGRKEGGKEGRKEGKKEWSKEGMKPADYNVLAPTSANTIQSAPKRCKHPPPSPLLFCLDPSLHTCKYIALLLYMYIIFTYTHNAEIYHHMYSPGEPNVLPFDSATFGSRKSALRSAQVCKLIVLHGSGWQRWKGPGYRRGGRGRGSRRLRDWNRWRTRACGAHRRGRQRRKGTGNPRTGKRPRRGREELQRSAR